MKLTGNKRVQAYLKQACKKITSRKASAEVREELLGHIADALERGMSTEAALAQLGKPQTFARDFGRIHRPIYFSTEFLIMVAMMVFVIGILVGSSLVRSGFETMVAQVESVVYKHQRIFEEDQRILAEENLFRISGQKRDAGPFLNPKVKWEGVNNAVPKGKFSFLNRPAEISLQENVQKILAESAGHWTSLADTNIDAKVDLRWMKELDRFDYWDLFQWMPLDDIMKDIRESIWYEFPIPDMMSLKSYAQLRLIRGLRTGQMVPALREVRHLSDLLYSTEILIGSMMSVAVLNLEREAYEEAVRRKVISASDWKPVSKEIATRAKRTMFAYGEIIRFGMSEKTLEELEQRGAWAGYCSGLAEASIGAMILRDQLGGKVYPFEIDLNHEFKKFENRVSHGPCRVTYAKALLKQRGTGQIWFPDFVRWSIVARIPIVRQWYAFEMAKTAVGDFMSGPYERNKLPSDQKLYREPAQRQ